MSKGITTITWDQIAKIPETWGSGTWVISRVCSSSFDKCLFMNLLHMYNMVVVVNPQDTSLVCTTLSRETDFAVMAILARSAGEYVAYSGSHLRPAYVNECGDVVLFEGNTLRTLPWATVVYDDDSGHFLLTPFGGAPAGYLESTLVLLSRGNRSRNIVTRLDREKFEPGDTIILPSGESYTLVLT